MKLTRITASDKSTIEVKDSVFGQTPVKELIAQALYVYQSNQRQATSKVKTRSEINRTKKKWFKQKGTGNARHGARTPSIFVGGGVAHGPTGIENYSKTLTKNQKKKSMIYALSAQKENIAVLDGLSDLSGKSKEAFLLLKNVTEKSERILVVLHETLIPAVRAMRNMANVIVTRADRMNIYETINAQKIVMTEEAVRVLENRLTETASKPKVEKKAEVKVEKIEKVAPKKAPVKVEKKVEVKEEKKPVVKKAPVKKVAPKKAAVKTVKAKKAAK